AELINFARGFMISVGCIMALVCQTNNCPAGVATTDTKLQQGLNSEEKTYGTCNYIVTMRQGVFELACVAGIDSPTKFTREHLVYKDEFDRLSGYDEIKERVM